MPSLTDTAAVSVRQVSTRAVLVDTAAVSIRKSLSLLTLQQCQQGHSFLLTLRQCQQEQTPLLTLRQCQ